MEDIARCPCMVSVYRPTWVLLTYKTIHISHHNSSNNICLLFMYRTFRGLLSLMARDKESLDSHSPTQALLQVYRASRPVIQGITSYAAKKTPGLSYTGFGEISHRT